MPMIDAPFYPSKFMFSSELHSTLAAFTQRTLKTDAAPADLYQSGVLKDLCQSLVDSTQSDFNFLCYGLNTLNQVALMRFSTDYAQLSFEQQDMLMLHMELGELPEFSDAPRFYNLLHRLVFKAKFSKPINSFTTVNLQANNAKLLELH